MPHRVVCAVDFGTHGSGFAWTALDDPVEDESRRDIFGFENWPGQPVAYPKTRTALLLDASGEVLEWGHPALARFAEHSAGQAGARLVQRFKMWLHPDDGVVNRLGGSRAEALPLITAYLQRLYRLAVDQITGSGYLETDIRWCLTLPAMWNDLERDLTRKAAEQAGFPATRDGLLVVTEPEAAAVYAAARKSLAGDRPQAPLMVVDCGGGTVDIAAHRADPGGQLHELGRPEGRQLGSEYINESFRRSLLDPRLTPAFVARLEREAPGDLQQLVQDFELRKRDFAPDSERAIELSLRGRAMALLLGPEGEEARQSLREQQDGIDYLITVRPEEMTELFDTVVTPLLGLVEEQLGHVRGELPPGAGPVRVLLVGGFAESAYLKTRLKERLAERFGGEAELVVPGRPGQAVLYGAVHYACRPRTVASRKARRSYGITTTEPVSKVGVFKRRPGEEKSRIYKDEDGRRRLDKVFKAAVEAGDSVGVDQVWTTTLEPVYESQTSLSTQLYSTPRRGVRYADQEGADCRMLTSLSVPLGDAMRLPREQRTIRIDIRFGETNLYVTATNVRTGATHAVDMTFDAEDQY
jgi:molecular chaperone DnaK (HSP70)